MSIQQNFPAISPSLSLNFARSKTLDPRITFTRTSSATRVNGQGLIEVVPTNAPRFDHSYDPVSGTVRSLGLLVEEARTNSIRNNTGVGAVVGTPGTLPTNWFGPLASGNLTSREIVGTGTENGIAYIDVRLVASGAVDVSIYPEFGNFVTASNNQIWAHSAYVKLVGGSIANLSPSLGIVENNSSGNFLAAGNTAYSPTSAGLATQRVSFTRTNTNASTAFVQPRFRFEFSGAGDITIRIGLPQLELGAFPTSVIPTSGSTATRTADNVSMVGENFSSWYNSSEGSIYTEAASFNPTGADNFAFVIPNGTVNVRGLSANFIGTTLQVRIRGESDGIVFENYVIPNGSHKKIILTHQNIVGASSVDGSIITEKTITPLLPASNFFIGSRQFLSHLNGTIRNITYYPKRLPNAFLQNLTK